MDSDVRTHENEDAISVFCPAVSQSSFYLLPLQPSNTRKRVALSCHGSWVLLAMDATADSKLTEPGHCELLGYMFMRLIARTGSK